MTTWMCHFKILGQEARIHSLLTMLTPQLFNLLLLSFLVQLEVANGP
jgi:hypothetical protein